MKSYDIMIKDDENILYIHGTKAIFSCLLTVMKKNMCNHYNNIIQFNYITRIPKVFTFQTILASSYTEYSKINEHAFRVLVLLFQYLAIETGELQHIHHKVFYKC